VLTTCGNEAEADALASMLVERRLAACVNRISGIASTYRWQGSVERDRETLLLIKTTGARLAEVELAIRSASAYELPEVLAVPIEAGADDYLRWLCAAAGPED
jgi:periplasmic divalent cation tolerance protein